MCLRFERWARRGGVSVVQWYWQPGAAVVLNVPAGSEFICFDSPVLAVLLLLPLLYNLQSMDSCLPRQTQQPMCLHFVPLYCDFDVYLLVFMFTLYLLITWCITVLWLQLRTRGSMPESNTAWRGQYSKTILQNEVGSVLWKILKNTAQRSAPGVISFSIMSYIWASQWLLNTECDICHIAYYCCSIDILIRQVCYTMIELRFGWFELLLQ